MSGPIVILGAERSGTSACAEMVAAWGAYMGEPAELPLADDLNPHGRWEWLPLWDFLAELGEFEAGHTWWEEGFQEWVTSKASAPGPSRTAKTLIERMRASGRPWAWKDPALCHFLGFWMQVWTAPTFVVMVRNPVDIAVSWNQFRVANARRPLSLRCNVLRWQHMMLSVLRAIDGLADALFVEFEQMTAAPQVQARRMAEFLDRRTGRSSPPHVIANMANTCDPALRRNHRPAAVADLDSAQVSLYNFLRARVTDPSAEFVDRFPMAAGWRRLVMDEEGTGESPQPVC